MKTTKIIEYILAPPVPHFVGNGFNVHNFFPSLLDPQRMSPFFLLDYNAKMLCAPSDIPRGVGVHPHRGIETVTVSFEGKVAHHDSAGHGGIIGKGDVQWMTAGGGILHKEYYEETFNREGGDFHLAQIWVNLPQKDKMTPPKYQSITHDETPVFQLGDHKGVVEVIAGNYNGIKGAAFTFSPIELYNIRLAKGSEITVDLPAEYNTGILVVKGKVKANNSDIVPADHFILFRNEGEIISLKAEEDCMLLVMSGQPLDEPISAAGPFVMNTRKEIIQAYQDYDEGKFGYLED